MKTVCCRCGKKIRADKSAFCVLMKNINNKLYKDLHFTSKLTGGEVAIHPNGDRECGKEIASYRRTLLDKLNLPIEYDISALDSY